ncbi:hypothetical protein Sjap_012308 [Stephania japonica]|uniref:MBD domain-containing protein n=1 Tax=Stephania japonica TaxID=461633 RepID=A0AAP0IVS6_9MAGN
MEPKTLKEILSDLENAELENELGDLPNDKPWSSEPIPLEALDVDPTQWDCFSESLEVIIDFPNNTTTTNTTNNTNNANNDVSSMDTTSDRCSSIASSDAVAGTGGGEVAAEKASLRKRKGKAAALPDNSWLPPGWVVERRVRTSGRSAGAVDTYYYDPERKKKFRSKNEVFHYLSMGTDGYKSRRESSSKKSCKRSGNAKATKKVVEVKEHLDLDLDFEFADLPDWTMPSALEGEVHFIGDLKIHKSVNG